MSTVSMGKKIKATAKEDKQIENPFHGKGQDNEVFRCVRDQHRMYG